MISLREEILYRSRGEEKGLFEMAATELAKVVELIKSGNVDEAAAKYIEYGGNPSSSGVAKTVNSFLKKNPAVDANNFETFKSSVTKVAADKGVKSARPEEYKTGTTGMTRKGEEIVVKGMSPEAKKENVLKTIDKQKKEIDAERAMLDAGTDIAGLRKMAIEMVKDMKFATLTDEDKNFIATLKKFSTTGEDKGKAIDIMHTIVDEGEKVMVALKKRVAGGGMVKPTDQTLKLQADKYKKIDSAKAQKSLEADKQKQLEAK
jgi:hypothetical protein